MKRTREDIEELPTLCRGQADDLKIDGDEDGLRVWLSRVDNSVSYERLVHVGGRPAWRTCDHEGNLL